MGKLSEAQKDQVKTLRAEGMSLGEISKKLKELYGFTVHISTLSYIIKPREERKAGIPKKKTPRGKAQISKKDLTPKTDLSVNQIIAEIMVLLKELKQGYIDQLKSIRVELLKARGRVSDKE